MPATTRLTTSPALSDYLSLEDYQSSTPETFVGGKPVLHHHVAGVKVWIDETQRGKISLFSVDNENASEGSTGKRILLATRPHLEQKVDLFVNSENFTIFSPEAATGMSIPYPCISIHAIKEVQTDDDPTKHQAVWMQLDFSDGGADDDSYDAIELTIIPSDNDAKKLYDAMADCSDLNPDPNDDEEDEEDDPYDRIIFEGDAQHEAVEGFTGVLHGASNGGLPPPMPGSGGWITADNVHEYFDESGNWIGQNDEQTEELGEGAGRVRQREEVDGEGLNGNGTEEDTENKRPRVEE